MAGVIYEVWSVPSGSVLMAYPTEEDALGLVRGTFEQFGADAVRSLMIVREQRGRSRVVWDGAQLAKRFAERAAPDQSSRPAGTPAAD